MPSSIKRNTAEEPSLHPRQPNDFTKLLPRHMTQNMHKEFDD